MKKILALMLMGCFLLTTVPVYAVEMMVTNRDEAIKIHMQVNTTGDPLTSGQISDSANSILVPDTGSGGHRIVAISVTSTAGAGGNAGGDHTECVVALYDESGDLIQDDAELEAEIESDGTKTAEKIFVYPYKIRNGVLIRQGAFTAASIEYEYYGR